MLTQPDQFPPDRRADPMRRAETRVFDAIQSSDRSGLAIYEWQRNPGSPQLDFAIWTQGGGRFGLQVKGGQISLENGKWYLETPGGSEEKPSPAVRDLGRSHVPPGGHHRCPWEGHLLLRHRGAPVSRHGARPGPSSAEGQAQQTSHVLWGTDNLMDRLAAIAARKAYYPPNADDIRREVAAVTDGQIAYIGEVQAQPEGPAVPRLEIPARRHHHRARGHSDCPHGARPGDGRRSGAWSSGARPGSSGTPYRDHGRSSLDDDRPPSGPAPEKDHCSGTEQTSRSQHNQTLKEEET